jgi:hypothetical protein
MLPSLTPNEVSPLMCSDLSILVSISLALFGLLAQDEKVSPSDSISAVDPIT